MMKLKVLSDTYTTPGGTTFAKVSNGTFPAGDWTLGMLREVQTEAKESGEAIYVLLTNPADEERLMQEDIKWGEEGFWTSQSDSAPEYTRAGMFWECLPDGSHSLYRRLPEDNMIDLKAYAVKGTGYMDKQGNWQSASNLIITSSKARAMDGMVFLHYKYISVHHPMTITDITDLLPKGFVEKNGRAGKTVTFYTGNDDVKRAAARRWEEIEERESKTPATAFCPTPHCKTIFEMQDDEDVDCPACDEALPSASDKSHLGEHPGDDPSEEEFKDYIKQASPIRDQAKVRSALMRQGVGL